MDARNPRLGTALWALAVAVAYFGLARASLQLVDPDSGVATIWPAAGLALAAFILAPRRRWPALAVAVGLGDLGAQLLVRDSLLVAVALALCTPLQAYVSARVMALIAQAPRPRVGSLDTVGALIAAGVGAGAVVALPGAAVMCLSSGTTAGFGSAWLAWWMANAVGILVVTPVVLALLEPGPDRAGPWEAAVLVALTGAAAMLVFWHRPDEGPALLRFAFPLLPLLLWCSVRIGARATTFASVLVAMIASLATSRGLGPFAMPGLDPHQQVQVLQAFLALVVVSTLLVGAIVADQRRSRSLARREADRLASVLRASSEISIIGTDLDGRVTVFSPGAEQLTGRRAVEMLGRPMIELHDAEEIAARAAELGVAPGLDAVVHRVRLGGSERRDWTYVHVDASRRRGSITVTGQYDARGGLTGFLAIATDVTAQRTAEHALAASEERHRLVLSSLPDTQVHLFDRDLTCVLGEGTALPQALRDTAYVGRPLARLLPAEQLAEVEPLCRAALQGRTGQMEYRSSHTGLLHDVQAAPYRAPDGRIDGVLLVMRDITERDVQLRALRRAENDLRTIFDQAPIGHAILNEFGALHEGNAAMAAITGYDAERLHETGVENIVHPDDLGPLRALLAAVRTGDTPAGELEVRLRHRDGQMIDVALHVAALSSADHEQERTLIQIVDITHRKRLEEQLRALAERDALTGLLNRRRFDEELDAHLERSRRYGSEGAVVMVDVDDFKRVNDTYGHHAGDELIVAVAELLGRRLRSSDVVARLGGDEFALLLPRATREDAERLAGALVGAVRDELSVTISLGVAMVGAPGARSGAQLMMAADRALYEAKAAGRDGHAFAVPV